MSTSSPSTEHALSMAWTVAAEVLWHEAPEDLPVLTAAWISLLPRGSTSKQRGHTGPLLPATGMTPGSTLVVLRTLVKVLCEHDELNLHEATLDQLTEAVRAAGLTFGLQGTTLQRVAPQIAGALHTELHYSSPQAPSPRQRRERIAYAVVASDSPDACPLVDMANYCGDFAGYDLVVDEYRGELHGRAGVVPLASIPRQPRAMLWIALTRSGTMIDFSDIKRATRTATNQPEAIRKFVSFGNVLLEQLIDRRPFVRSSVGVYRVDDSDWTWKWVRRMGPPEISLLIH